MRFVLPTLAGILSSFAPKAYAQDILGVIDIVSGRLSGFTTDTGEFGDIAGEIALSFLPLLNGIAILTIVIAGLLAVIAQDENRIQNARFTVVSAIIALVLINATGAIADAYLTAFDYDGSADPVEGARIVSEEILGFVRFMEVPLAIIAVMVIIISGIKAVIDYTGEKGLTQFRGTFFSILFGVIIILAKNVLANAIVIERRPDPIVEVAMDIAFTIVGYIALIAFIVIVIAGIMMIANLGNEEQYTKAKTLIVRVILGIVIILLVATLFRIILEGVFS